MPLSEEDKAHFKAELKEAARILREDRVSVSLAQLRERFDKHFPSDDTTDPEADDDTQDGPKPPPKKDPPTEPPKPKSAWWGEALND